MNPDRESAAPQAALVLAGLTAVAAQVLLLRELEVLFNGNELALGILLACWLLWTAAGSALAGFVRVRNARWVVVALETAIAAALPATLWALRLSRGRLETVPGELLGPVPMLLDALVCLSVFCLLSGALFGSAARLLKRETAAGRAYLLEAAGSALGGLLLSLVLLRALTPFQIALGVALLNLVMAVVLLSRTRRVAVILAGAGVVCASVPLLFLAAPRLETAARARLWTGFELVAVRDTVYSNLAVTRTGELRSLYANGTLLTNAPDPAAAEEAMLPALLEHPAPARVLVLGGCANGLSLVLEQPSVRSVDCVELDPGLIELARATLAAPFPVDGRLHLQLADGRQFLANSNEQYDAILVNLPDPSTAQINRYYTVEFFRLAKAHLAQGGLVALQLRSSEETISPALAEFLRSIRRTLGEVFPRVAVIPGETLHMFASADAQALTEDAGVLVKRMHARGLQPQYVSEYILPYRMTVERMEGIHRTLVARGDTPVNRDLAPVAYAFSTLLWSTQFSPRTAEWFQAAAHLPFRMVLMAACGFVLVALAALWFAGNRRRTAAAASTASAGFTLMALEIVLLLGYESVYGTVYSGLAILIGLFMAGMAVGGWLGLRRGAGRAERALAATQAALAVAAPALVLVVWAMDRLGSGLLPAMVASVAAQIVFPALALGAGALGGFQFPAAAELFLPADESRFGLGVLYALDLLGGCVGALLLAGFLIPVYGFVRTAALVAVVNGAAVVLAVRAAQTQTVVLKG